MSGKTPLVLGILAHVDAGKTTLSEAMLYRSGVLRRLGRVDHGDAFLDTDQMERERGITIFSKQAIFPLGELEITLLDTPGHVDFSAEMERSLSVMDCAVLVISGSQGIQGHTRTLWRLLGRYGVPCFLFVNKMDLAGADRQALMSTLHSELSDAAVDFSREDGEIFEDAAALEEQALEEYLSDGALSRQRLGKMIASRKLFPVYFGSALKLEGVDEFLAGLSRYLQPPRRGEEFSATVYKIGRDPQGTRLSFLKLTGGRLRVKESVPHGPEGDGEKVDQIRLYSGEKYTTAEEIPAGTLCAVTGLERSFAGEILGAGGETRQPMLEPVLRYELILPPGADPHDALGKMRRLEEEDPQLKVDWNAAFGKIHLRLMGRVQLEILQRMILERWGMQAAFGPPGVVYRETITNTVEGVGHFEPLRHYAEVHLLLQPLPRGSGLLFDSLLSEDKLDRNWQRLVLTHLAEKTHLGVLTGSPITDMRVSLVAGAASVKHTEGGDFREATYRALRQGLMQADSLLLEPWVDFILTVPAENTGRAMADLGRMNARSQPPEMGPERTILRGSAPFSLLVDYPAQLAAYTRGAGSLTTTLAGYEPCHNSEEVIAAAAYDPTADLENTPDSVFCAHGAGYPVRWDQVPQKMHLESVLEAFVPRDAAPDSTQGWEEIGLRRAARRYDSIQAQDAELQAIFEQTYGRIQRRDILPGEERRKYEPKKPHSVLEKERVELKPRPAGEEYLLVDGYNIIYAWDQLRKLAGGSIDLARQRLMDLLADYHGLRQNRLILVFDAYKVPGGTGSVEEYHGISVVYTKEAETADAYIEKTAHRLKRDKKARVFVATSDGPEQVIILGAGALRMTPSELLADLRSAREEVDAVLQRSSLPPRSEGMRAAFEKAAEKEKGSS